MFHNISVNVVDIEGIEIMINDEKRIDEFILLQVYGSICGLAMLKKIAACLIFSSSILHTEKMRALNNAVVSD